jgi:uncharacterized damage-inducible protein DinB
MTDELALTLLGESAHAAPAKILEGLPDELTHRAVPGAPHTVYQELWHIIFWQQITLDWISGIETPFPANTNEPFPSDEQTAAEPWSQLCRRFHGGAKQAAAIANDQSKLAIKILCPSRPGNPVRVMSVQDQLISLAAHNAYHLGRIVLLRQLLGTWPPPSGGFSW